MPDSNLPAPRPAGGRSIDRAALERVLARAAELQGAAGDASEPGDELTEEQLLELGREVGLSQQHLRQALAEERTRVAVPPERGMAATLVGPGIAAASRTVRGTVAGVLAALDAWMLREECLRSKRRFPDRLVWEPAGGLMTDVSRLLNLKGRGYHLRRAAEVSATVVPVDAQQVLVRLDADLRGARSASTTSSVLSVGGGTVMGVALVALHVMVPVAIIPSLLVGGGGIWAARQGYRRALGSAQLALEQILDRLEQGEIRPPSGSPLLDVALDVMGRRR